MNKFIDFVSKKICDKDSKVGDVLEVIAGRAKECWCCSMVRGIIVGAAVVGVIWALTSVL